MTLDGEIELSNTSNATLGLDARPTKTANMAGIYLQE